MQQKINFRMIFLTILAVLTTMVSITYVYYSLFQKQIRDDLRLEARLLAEAGFEKLIGNEWAIEEEEIRITWISEDGEVLFDNDVAADNLGNHLNRPEVKAALENGFGESVRESDTMKLKTYYHALRLENNTIIRVSKDASSYLNLFISTLPVAFTIIILVIILCITISHYLTRQLMEPIREMAENMDQISHGSSYKELDPFIDRIREQHDDILSSAKARQEFTANVSHELKTPIAAISGYAELIENQMVDENMQIKFAGDIRKNADRLVTLVNDIIRLSELDQSSISPSFSRVNLYEIAEERVELLKNHAREKQITLSLKGSTCDIMANRSMMIELLDNLIENAIRYNVQNGKVLVEVRKEENKGILRVSDTGIGIPKADQERVYERFYRVDKSRSRETGGTGLGLAIVKHIIELHEGTITLESAPGKGSVFEITL